MAVEGLHRAVELGGGLRGGLEPVRWEVARLALAAGRRGSGDNCPRLGRLRFLLTEQDLEPPRQAGAAIRRLRFLLGLADAPMVRNKDPGTYWYFYDIGGLDHVTPALRCIDQALARRGIGEPGRSSNQHSPRSATDQRVVQKIGAGENEAGWTPPS